MIWLLYILLDSLANWYLIVKKKTKPVYFQLFLIRGIAAICYGAFVLDVDQDTFLNWAGRVLLTFPFLFNTLLNTWRKLPLDYVGKESGWIDSFIYKHGLQRPYYWFTLALFVVAIRFLYIAGN